MTQLIGMLCEDRDKAVLVSDRMVTTSNGSLAFEHEPKCAFVASNALVLTAGTIHEPELITNTQAEIKGKGSLIEIAESLAKNYRQIRRKRVEHEILQEMGILSFDDFYNKQSSLHEHIILGLSGKIGKYDLGVHLLLAGADEKAHLYRIGEPGTYRSFDELGFCCIGSGDRHAEPVFAFYGFSPKLSIKEALTIAFEAKKRSEMAGGVGKETDAWIIEKENLYEIDQETINQLETSRTDEEDFLRLIKSTEVEIKTNKMEFTTTKT